METQAMTVAIVKITAYKEWTDGKTGVFRRRIVFDCGTGSGFYAYLSPTVEKPVYPSYAKIKAYVSFRTLLEKPRSFKGEKKDDQIVQVLNFGDVGSLEILEVIKETVDFSSFERNFSAPAGNSSAVASPSKFK